MMMALATPTAKVGIVLLIIGGLLIAVALSRSLKKSRGILYLDDPARMESVIGDGAWTVTPGSYPRPGRRFEKSRAEN